MSKSRANELFDTMDLHYRLEEEVGNELMRCCDIDPESTPDTWPLQDITFDSYDCSFEFMGCKSGWKPTQEQLDKCLALGFLRCGIRWN